MDKLARTVSDAIAARFGFDVPVIVKSSTELDAIVTGLGFSVPEENYSKLLIAFAQSDDAIASLDALAALVSPPELLQIDQRCAYLYCPSGLLQSKAAEALLGKVGKSITSRNWATVLKLHALAAQNAA